MCFSINADELLAAGHKHFKVWTLSGGGLMQGKRGLFGSGSKVGDFGLYLSCENVKNDACPINQT